MDISAQAISLPVKSRTDYWGHQCSHAPGRPILHLVSTSRRPRRVRVLATSSIGSLLHAVPLFALAVVPSSRPAGARGSSRSGRHRIGLDALESAPLV